MDADTTIDPNLLKNAEAHFAADPHMGAVSPNHLVEFKRTAIELLQAMEYERDRRMIGRRKGRYGCMTGMAAMYRVAAMQDVKARYGSVYDPDNWTEDWKLTIALKTLGWGMVRPQDCLATSVPVTDRQGLVRPAGALGARVHPDAEPVRPDAVDRLPVAPAAGFRMVAAHAGGCRVPDVDLARPHHRDLDSADLLVMIAD